MSSSRFRTNSPFLTCPLWPSVQTREGSLHCASVSKNVANGIIPIHCISLSACLTIYTLSYFAQTHGANETKPQGFVRISTNWDTLILIHNMYLRVFLRQSVALCSHCVCINKIFEAKVPCEHPLKLWLQVPPTRRQNIRRFGLHAGTSFWKKNNEKSSSLRSALSVDLENPEVEKIRKEFEMYR